MKKNNRKYIKNTLFIAIISALGSSLPVYSMAAADPATEDPEVEKIVVTARRVNETIQESPIAITVFGGKQIDDSGISETADFIQLTSNVTLAESQSIGTSFLTIRGLSQVRNGEIPVAVVIDGVLQFNGAQFIQQMFDVEQIEIVKGPQGALYGRNATGGAVIINTTLPMDNETEGYIKFGIGEANEITNEGAVGGSIIDDELYFRVSARSVNRDGYYTNATRNDDSDPLSDQSLRGRLFWEPSDDISMDFKVNTSRNVGRGIGFQFAPIYGESNDDANVKELPYIANNEDRGTRDTVGLSLVTKVNFDTVSFSSITSWDDIESSARADQFPYTAFANGVDSDTPFGDGTQATYEDTSGWSQEFRLNSNTDSPLQWEFGAYYLSWDRFRSSTIGLDTGDGVRRVERTPYFDDINNPTTAFFADENENDAWAVFGQINYVMSEQLSLTLAGRYDEETRTQFVSQFNTGGTPGAINKATFDKFQPKVTLSYSPTELINLYATWGEGFRSGQFNQNGTGEAAEGAGIIGVSDKVAQENSESLEIGFKTDLFDEKLRFNGSFFDTTVEGQQYYAFIGGIGAQVLISIDEVSLQGAEFEVIYKLTDDFNLFASYGYIDSEIIKYDTDQSLVGNKAPYIADSTFNAGFQWLGDFSESLNIITRVDYEKRGEQFWSPNNVAPRDPITLVNARVALEDKQGDWSLSASVKNATDEKFNSEFVLGGYIHRANPRVWRVEYRYNF